MITNKNVTIAAIVLAVVLIGFYMGTRSSDRPGAEVALTPVAPSTSFSPKAIPSGTGQAKGRQEGNVGTGTTSFIDEPVPWSLLLGEASCELKGEIKFLEHNLYNNQDAMFSYKGVDHPGRNVFWTVTPQDDLSVGPNILNRTTLPDGESLLGIILPDNPKYKKYELTAKIQYGRLVDEKGKFVIAGGDVKVFDKQCIGKTTVVLP